MPARTDRHQEPPDPPHGVAAAVFNGFPYGILLFDARGRLELWNRVAGDLIPDLSVGDSCCDLLGCRSSASLEEGCVSELATRQGGVLPEVRVDARPAGRGTAVWVTACARTDGDGTLMQVRPGDRDDRRRRTRPHWTMEPRIRICTFGPMRVESREGDLGGGWLAQRPGQILKLLVCERGHTVQTDAITEAIWPEAGMQGAGTVRYFVHALRHTLEPERAPRVPSAFVVARAGGYTLNPATVEIDADVFEREVDAGLAAYERGDVASAEQPLRSAVAIYTGEFLADEPYAQWVIPERERLRTLATDALRALASITRARQDLTAAAGYFQQLAEMLPYDLGVQRRMLALLVADGRLSEAARSYDVLRVRLASIFDEELDFDLADIAPQEAFAQ